MHKYKYEQFEYELFKSAYSVNVGILHIHMFPPRICGSDWWSRYEITEGQAIECGNYDVTLYADRLLA